MLNEPIAYCLTDFHAGHPDKMDHLVLLGGDIVAVTFSCRDAADLVAELEYALETERTSGVGKAPEVLL